MARPTEAQPARAAAGNTNPAQSLLRTGRHQRRAHAGLGEERARRLGRACAPRGRRSSLQPPPPPGHGARSGPQAVARGRLPVRGRGHQPISRTTARPCAPSSQPRNPDPDSQPRQPPSLAPRALSSNPAWPLTPSVGLVPSPLPWPSPPTPPARLWPQPRAAHLPGHPAEPHDTQFEVGHGRACARPAAPLPREAPGPGRGRSAPGGPGRRLRVGIGARQAGRRDEAGPDSGRRRLAPAGPATRRRRRRCRAHHRERGQRRGAARTHPRPPLPGQSWGAHCTGRRAPPCRCQ